MPAPLDPAADRRLSERLRRSETLRTTAEYRRLAREGARRHGPLLQLQLAPNRLAHPRIGTTVGRKVGGAVVRNRLKRWTRECYRRSALRAALPSFDLVVQPKPAAATAPFAAYRAELERLLAQLPAGGVSDARDARDAGRSRRRAAAG